MIRTAFILSSFITCPVLLLCALDIFADKNPAMRRFMRWLARHI